MTQTFEKIFLDFYEFTAFTYIDMIRESQKKLLAKITVLLNEGHSITLIDGFLLKTYAGIQRQHYSSEDRADMIYSSLDTAKEHLGVYRDLYLPVAERQMLSQEIQTQKSAVTHKI